MVLSAIHIGTQIKYRGGAASGIGQLRGNGRSVYAVHGFEHVAGNRHQRASIACGHGGLSHTVLDLIDGHPHGGILFASQRYFYGVIHGDDLTGSDDLAAGMRLQSRVLRMSR